MLVPNLGCPENNTRIFTWVEYIPIQIAKINQTLSCQVQPIPNKKHVTSHSDDKKCSTRILPAFLLIKFVVITLPILEILPITQMIPGPSWKSSSAVGRASACVFYPWNASCNILHLNGTKYVDHIPPGNLSLRVENRPSVLGIFIYVPWGGVG